MKSSFGMFVAVYFACQAGSGESTNRSSSEKGGPASAEQSPTGRPFVTALVIDSYRIRLDSALTLSAVQNRLGPSQISKPAHHDGFWSTCHLITAGQSTVRLTLKSDEMGGTDHRILGFDLDAVDSSAASDSLCQRSRTRSASIATDNGLRVGMSEDELLLAMGQPTKRDGDSLEFQVAHHVASNASTPAYDIAASLKVRLTRGRVTRLSAWYVEVT